MKAVCCHPDCHRFLDVSNIATGRKATMEEYEKASHGLCNEHIEEWYAKHPTVKRRAESNF